MLSSTFKKNGKARHLLYERQLQWLRNIHNKIVTSNLMTLNEKSYFDEWLNRPLWEGHSLMTLSETMDDAIRHRDKIIFSRITKENSWHEIFEVPCFISVVWSSEVSVERHRTTAKTVFFFLNFISNARPYWGGAQYEPPAHFSILCCKKRSLNVFFPCSWLYNVTQSRFAALKL